MERGDWWTAERMIARNSMSLAVNFVRHQSQTFDQQGTAVSINEIHTIRCEATGIAPKASKSVGVILSV